EVRVLVERVRQRPRRAPGRVDDGDALVARVVARAAHLGGERDPLAVGRPARARVGPRLGDEHAYGVVGELQQIDVGGRALDEVGVLRGAEGNARAVRRPGEVGGAEVGALRALPSRPRRLLGLRYVDREEMAVAVVPAHHLVFAVALLAVLAG